MDTLRPLPRARVRRLALIAPVALLATLAAPIPASAGVFSAAGVRCTIVGTSGNDKLNGTAGKDVICGLGGNDKINGGAGNDVIDGGSGADTIQGGAGDDREIGGAGNDRVDGGAGSDRVDGGPGNDTLVGGDGGDLVLGGGGNDDLDGQGGKDSLNGGKGTNWCTVGSKDTEKACVYDKAAPTAGAITLTATTVDVTTKDVQVMARVRMTDDTGVSGIQIGGSYTTADGQSRSIGLVGAHLVSGTVRDGVWQAGTVIQRYTAPGEYKFDVSYRDRVGRSGYTTTGTPSLTVLDRNPDTEPAVVRSVALNARSFDVRSKAATVTVTARITDNLSGVRDVNACLWYPGGERMEQFQCPVMKRVSGTARDGQWRVTFTIPKGAVGGDWNVAISPEDWISNYAYYYGEDLYPEWTAGYPAGGNTDPWRLLPNARFSVLGAAETTAAWVKGMKVDRTSIDTLPGDQTVNVYVRAGDVAGEGVTDVGGGVQNLEDYWTGNGISLPYAYGTLHQGTAIDGWWKLTFTFPQGTPPGRYVLGAVNVSDKGHHRRYSPPASPELADVSSLPFPSGSVVTTDGAAWDGVITVVANPAG